MTHPITFAGNMLQLLGNGMLWWPAQRLLCAADIHFEKASFFSYFGSFLPPYDSLETLERLQAAIVAYEPHSFIALGDSFHDVHAAARMDGKVLTLLNDLIATVPDWQWVTGNHDPTIDTRVIGRRVPEVQIENIIFRHEYEFDSALAEISGHFHPKAAVTIKGTRISGPCFLSGRGDGDNAVERLILPAFGTLTGGLDVNDRELFKRIPVDGRQICLVHKQSVYMIEQAV